MARIEPWQQKLLTQSHLLRVITDPPSLSPATPPPVFVEMHRLAVEGERNRRMQETQFQFDMERAFRRR
jgi:hypothetical protein